MYIYLITNKINNKHYVGLTTKTVEERFNRHITLSNNNLGFYLHNAIRKYGIENFELKTLDTSDNIEDLKDLEIKYIQEYDSFNSGYNLTKGGDFTSNDGFTVIKDKDKFKRIKIEDFDPDIHIHSNKNLITIFKDNFSKRATTEEYLILKKSGWKSKNFGLTTVKTNDGKFLKIPSETFNKDIHTGINTGKQIYYNSETKKFESICPLDVDLNIHFNKQKVKYAIYDSKNKLLEYSLDASKFSIENGMRQFRYLIRRRYKNQEEFILTEDVINKLKIKCRDYNLIGYRLIKIQL